MSKRYRFELIPTPIYLRIKHLFKKTQFHGNFKNYKEASDKVKGYVTNFSKHEHLIDPLGTEFDSGHIGIYLGLIKPPISKNVLDWGGGVGTIYYEMRKYHKANWHIVDLDDVVNYGKRKLQTEHLNFWKSIDTALNNVTPDTIVMNSSLHYAPDPYNIAKQLASIGSKKIIINRTLIADKHKVLIQRDPGLSNSSCPVTFIEEKRLLSLFNDYRLIFSFDIGHRDGNLYGKYKHMCYYLEKNKN